MGYESVDSVIMVPMTSGWQFIYDWNGIGTVNGELVTVDLIYINAHGKADAIQAGSSGDDIPQSYIQYLEPKNAGSLILQACFTGATNNSIASDFARVMNGASILTSANLSSGYALPFLGYLAQGEGWVKFTAGNGGVERQLLNRHWMSTKGMLRELGY